jgi:hypothetical protein
VTEVLKIDEEMQELILKNASEEELFQSARKKGFVTIQEDAIIKALNHEIPYEEMTAFSTKVGIDMIEDTPDETVDMSPVDNLQDIQISKAIMNSDEITTD